LGLDKRTIWPGIALLVIWFVWAHAVPWIDHQIDLDDPIVAGDVINLGAGELTFVPAVGWNLESGTRLTEGDEDRVAVPTTADLSSDLVAYKARSAPWDGTADELVDQMLEVDERLGQLGLADERVRVDVANADGVPGRLAYIVGDDESVLLAAFAFEGSGDPVGVEIEVRGTPADMRDLSTEIAGMMETTRYEAASGEGGS
jgi:hypothetical protein